MVTHIATRRNLVIVVAELIIAVIVCVLAWKRLNSKPAKRAFEMATIAMLAIAITAFTAGSIPIIEIPTGLNQELRVMPPTAFPLTMQQHRNYDTNQFYYRIVVGWPNGVPIYEGPEVDDQSEFIHQTHYYTAILLGEDISAVLMMALSLFFLLEGRKDSSKRSQRKRITRIILAASIFLLSFVLYLFPHHLAYISPDPLFRVVFWGSFVGIGVYALALLTLLSEVVQYTVQNPVQYIDMNPSKDVNRESFGWGSLCRSRKV